MVNVTCFQKLLLFSTCLFYRLRGKSASSLIPTSYFLWCFIDLNKKKMTFRKYKNEEVSLVKDDNVIH